MGKLRQKEVKDMHMYHTANKLQNQDSNPDSLAIEPGRLSGRPLCLIGTMAGTY